jgi:signal peptidase I
METLDDRDVGSDDMRGGGFSRIRRDWIEPILIAFLLVVLIRTFLFQPFKIPSGSMEDTLLIGDQLIAVKFLYGIRVPFTGATVWKFRDPRPGDIIVFRFPGDPSKDFIKRCIATEGQSVEIKNKEIFVDGKKQNAPPHTKFIDTTVLPAQFGPRDNLSPQYVPAGHMFVMGDNRDNSNDSRFWGTVPYRNIRGMAVIVYWSWDHDMPLVKIYRKVRWKRLFTPIR